MFHYSTFLGNWEPARVFTYLRIPGLGLSPEQLERAGVFSLDPPGRHHQIPVRLRHHHQVSSLDDASLDALDTKYSDERELLPMLHVPSESVSLSSKSICTEHLYLSMNAAILFTIIYQIPLSVGSDYLTHECRINRIKSSS